MAFFIILKEDISLIKDVTAGAKFSKFHQLRLRTTYRSAKLPKFHQLRLRGQCTRDQNFILKVHLRVGGLTLHKPADEI